MRLEFIFNSQTIECGKNWRLHGSLDLYSKFHNCCFRGFIEIGFTCTGKIVSGVEQYDNLRPLLDSSYPDLLYIDCMPVRQTEALAYRMYGQNTDFVYLGNLLAQGLDQTYYKKYKAVFFWIFLLVMKYHHLFYSRCMICREMALNSLLICSLLKLCQ